LEHLRWALTPAWEAWMLLDGEDRHHYGDHTDQDFFAFNNGQIFTSLRSFYRMPSERVSTQLSLLMELSSVYNSFRADTAKSWDAAQLIPTKSFLPGEPQLIRPAGYRCFPSIYPSMATCSAALILQEDISEAS
jgi:hypothetical protein